MVKNQLKYLNRLLLVNIDPEWLKNTNVRKSARNELEQSKLAPIDQN